MATTSPTRALPSPRSSPLSSPAPSKAPRGTSRPDPTPSASASTSITSPSTPIKPRAKPTLRILCYGDSLTSGYSSGPDHPYSLTLLRVLSQAFPSLNITADTDGTPGDVVCSSSTPGSRFLSRIEPKFLTRGGGTPYDWTVVLGGTNDLALGFGADQIFEELRRIWGVPLSKGGRVLACTVPEAAAKSTWKQKGEPDRDHVFARVDRKRDALNELIRNHKQEGFHVFDLQAAIPHHSMSTAERVRYWDDGTHLTPDGYDLMGEKIAAALVELIMPPGRLQPSANGAKRRRVMHFRDDEKRFEEESGDEKALDSGWIVVRRKDLE